MKNLFKNVIYLLTLLLFSNFTVFAEDASNARITQSKILVEEYEPLNKLKFDFGEHLLINTLGGAFSGAVMGGLIGLSVYEDPSSSSSTSGWEQNKSNSLKFMAAVGGFGAISGILFTLIEYNATQQFTYGYKFMEYSWYGGISGALLGSLGGLIPYSSTNKDSDLLKFTGYGAAAGLAVSWALYFFVPEKTTNIKMTSFYDFDLKSVNLVFAKNF